jgi:23S rRNA (uracil1939-C5)-methyltransferase
LLVSSQAFFQNNWEVTELISKKIAEVVAGLRPQIFFDLYAGVGTFTFLCATAVPKIVCVEENPHAVAALRMNREEFNWPQVTIQEGRVERVFEKLWRDAGVSDGLIFLDPPRQGLDQKLATFLAGSVNTKALIYVSCDPATLARDLKILLGTGNWKLGEIIPYDMFPRTKHVEAVAFLYYNESSRTK